MPKDIGGQEAVITVLPKKQWKGLSNILTGTEGPGNEILGVYGLLELKRQQ